MSTPPTLRLGIAMAGAVSAGAYTAGVMDYLIETLQRWQEAKDKEAHLSEKEKLVPPHSVLIDVLGGTSAGGISAAIAGLSFRHEHKPVRTLKDARHESDNLLFQAWVNLVDDPGKDNSFEKLLDPSDVEKSKKVESLLNSGFVDEIAERTAQTHFTTSFQPTPAFVSSDFELLLTNTNMRGIPVDVDFNSDHKDNEGAPTHDMSYHKMYAHFKTQPSGVKANGKWLDGSDHFKLDLENREDVDRFMAYAMSTSAFPFGLKARKHLKVKTDLMLNTVGKFCSQALLKRGVFRFKRELMPEEYDYVAVDGGALNNEPFTEMAQLMRERNPDNDGLAIIMIDPFPSFLEHEEHYQHPEQLHQLAGGLLAALRRQASFKEAELMDFDNNPVKRNMIYPRKRGPAKAWKKLSIACGALGGFSGFFSREFRLHDFFLGRDNCRNFLRAFFSYSYHAIDGKPDRKQFHPIHQCWSDAMVEKFGRHDKKSGKFFLPVIPDLSQFDEGANNNPFNYTYKDFPAIQPENILKLKPQISLRVACMIRAFMQPDNNSAQKKGKENDRDKLNRLVAKYVGRTSGFGYLLKGVSFITVPLVNYTFMPLGKYFARWKLKHEATKYILETIIKDFVENGLIDKDKLS